MVALFVTALDAYREGNVQLGKVKLKRRGRRELPAYMADPDAPPKKGLSGKALWDATDRFMSRLRGGKT